MNRQTSYRGGGGRLFLQKLPNRNPVNERDLGLAIRAQASLLRMIRAASIHGGDIRGAAEMHNIAKGIIWNLKNAPLTKASVKQLAFLLKVLGLDEAPLPNDPMPIPTRLLPKEPPGGRRNNFE